MRVPVLVQELLERPELLPNFPASSSLLDIWKGSVVLVAVNPAVNQADNSSQLHLIIRRAFVLLNTTNDNGNNNLKMNAICGALTLCRTRLSDFALTFHFHALEKETAIHPSVLAWRIPETGRAWWAAVYGVAQSRTRLERLSSSSSNSLSLCRRTSLFHA